MEKVSYAIADRDDNERRTNNYEEALEALRKRQLVRLIQKTTIYTENSQILIHVISDMKEPTPRKPRKR